MKSSIRQKLLRRLLLPPGMIFTGTSSSTQISVLVVRRPVHTNMILGPHLRVPIVARGRSRGKKPHNACGDCEDEYTVIDSGFAIF